MNKDTHAAIQSGLRKCVYWLDQKHLPLADAEVFIKIKESFAQHGQLTTKQTDDLADLWRRHGIRV